MQLLMQLYKTYCNIVVGGSQFRLFYLY